MNYFFFTDGRNYQRTNSMKRHELLSGKPFEGHDIHSAWNQLMRRIKRARRILLPVNVVNRASVINHARAIINSERKRAIYKNSLTYVKGWGKLIAYAIKTASVSERHHLSRAYARLK